MQQICDGLTDRKIDRLMRKWFRRLPHPFPASDRAAGYRYDLSILQAEFSLTQVFDRPVTGRQFFEQIIRDNLDVGRADQVQLIFGRRVTKRTPGRFRTRVITEGVVPSLHADYKHTRIKQYHKEGRALRTETIINDTYDFAIGRKVHNLSALRKVGFTANRRLLDVQKISHDCTMGQLAFDRINQPVEVKGQRASALRFGQARVMALLAAIVMVRFLPRGFSNADLRDKVVSLLCRPAGAITAGQMSYDLRRLKLHGLIEKIPSSHRYRITSEGMRAAIFLLRAHTHLLRPGMAAAVDRAPPAINPLRTAVANIDQAVDRAWRDVA